MPSVVWASKATFLGSAGLESLEAVLGLDQRHLFRGLGQRANRLVMTAMPDIEDIEAAFGHPFDFVVDLGHQGADGINDHRCAVGRGGDHFWGGAMGRKHDRSAQRYVLNVVDETDADTFESLDDPFVVDNLVIAIDRRFE